MVVTRTRPFNNREKELRTTNCCRVLADNSSGQQQVGLRVANEKVVDACAAGLRYFSSPIRFSFLPFRLHIFHLLHLLNPLSLPPSSNE